MKKWKCVVCRIWMAITVAVMFSMAMAPCHATAKSPEPATGELPDRRISVIGHRGAAGLAPENTLAAFARACEIDVDAVEFDVLLSADGQAVVYHDFRLKPELTRSPDGKWLAASPPPAVKDLSLADLKTYDVGRLKPGTGYSRRYPAQTPADGERIPTLREVIRLVAEQCNSKTQLWVEIKTTPEKQGLTPPPEAVSETVVNILREEKISDRVRILSFDWRNLMYVKNIAPDIPTVYLSLEGVRLNNIQPGRPGASPMRFKRPADASGPHTINI